MGSLNRPDKLTLDAYSDNQLQQNPNGTYNRFNTNLKTPILNAKGIQLLNANFVNSSLQLNDTAHLMFFYYQNASAVAFPVAGNLKCVRLHPSTYVPYPGYTGFVKNKYFNSVSEVVSALNVAATTGDNVTFNPFFLANGITFSYDTTTRKVSAAPGSAGGFISPAPADDPNVIALRSQIRMNTFLSFNTYGSAQAQPFVGSVSMNARLGFAMSYSARGLYWSGSAQQGCATSIGVPSNSAIEGDANPILLGTQNVSVYLSIISGSGIDATGRKNLLASIPIEVAPLFVNSYTASSVEKPAVSVSSEIYDVMVELLDDYGQPFLQPPNYNTSLHLALYY